MYVGYSICTCKAFSMIPVPNTYIGGITFFLLACLRDTIACIGFHLLLLRRNDMMLNLVSCYGIYYCLIVQSPYIYTVFILTFIDRTLWTGEWIKASEGGSRILMVASFKALCLMYCNADVQILIYV